MSDRDSATGRTSPRRTGVLRLVAGVALAILLLGAGYALAVLTYRQPPGEESAEAGFARDMSAHHAQGVEMAMIAYQGAELPTTRKVAYDIALTQQGQIGQMQTWLRQWNVLPTSRHGPMSWMDNGAQLPQADGVMPGMATNAEISQLRSATGRDLDILFAQLMIDHHLGAIHMIDAVLAETDREDVRELAEAMRAGQQGEIDVFTDLLATLDARPR